MSWSNSLYVGLGLAIAACCTSARAAINAKGDIGVQRPFFYGPAIKKQPAADSANKSSQKCSTNTEVAGLLKKYDHALWFDAADATGLYR
ncbi:MAG: hypothetical protein GY927_11790 [bacterium]|nr:hypothetical protein [bacterium]